MKYQKNKTCKAAKAFSITLIASALIFACQKKKDPPPAPTPTNTTQAHKNLMIAKVDNVDWTVYSISTLYAFILFDSGNSHIFGGQAELNEPHTIIYLSFEDSIGIHNLKNGSKYVGFYKDANALTFTSRTGTINISKADTGALSALKKFTATFSFNTDTIAGVSHKITNGVIDYQYSN